MTHSRKAEILDGLNAPIGHCGHTRSFVKNEEGEPERVCPWPDVTDKLLDMVIQLQDELNEANAKLAIRK